MRTRLILSILALAISLCVEARTISKPEKYDFMVDGIGYTVYSTEYYSPDDVYVSGIEEIYSRHMEIGDSTFVVPAIVIRPDDGKQFNVTGIGADMFSGLPGIKSVILPDCMLELRIGSFSECENLEHVYLGKSLTRMWGGNFSEDPVLKEIELPATLKGLYQWSFKMSGLQRVVFPDGINVDVGEDCFNCLENLEEVVFEEGAKVSLYIGSFVVCPRLRTIIFPAENYFFAPGTFFKLSALEELHLPYENDTDEVSRSRGWFNGSNFTGCPGLKRIYNPSPVPPKAYRAETYGWENYAEIFIDDQDDVAGVDKSVCVLYVPVGSVEAYRSDPAWNAFTHIEEYEPASAVDMTDDIKDRIRVSGNTVSISGCNEGTLIISTPDGRIVADKRISTGEFLLDNGIYLISYQGQVLKIKI